MVWNSVTKNKGKIAGGILGLLVALLLIVAWPILLAIFLVLVGVVLGAGYDQLQKAKRWLHSCKHRNHDSSQRR